MSVTAELQRQLPIGDVPAGAVERGGISLRLLLRSTKLESVAPLKPVVPEIMFMGSSSADGESAVPQCGAGLPVPLGHQCPDSHWRKGLPHFQWIGYAGVCR